MPTTTTQSDITNVPFWWKSLNWVRAFEDAMDVDPTQASIDNLKRQVTELKGTVDKLQSRLSAQDIERH
jgi:hypothetical protein